MAKSEEKRKGGKGDFKSRRKFLAQTYETYCWE